MTALDRRPDRGVTPIVGMILLLGIVAVAALGLFVVGTTLTGATQEAAEDQQTVESLQEFSAEIDRLIADDTDTGTFLIDGREGAVTAVEPSAGHVEVMIKENGSVRTLYDESLGAVRYEASETEFAYQAGGIWRGDADNRSVMIQPPRFEYRSSPAPTLTLPVISVRGSATDTGDFEGMLTVENRSDVYPAGPSHSNPLEADRVIVDVQSSYCSAWSGYVDDRTDGRVVEQCSQNTNTSVGELRVELPVADPPNRNVNGTMSVNTSVKVRTPSHTSGNGTSNSSVTVTDPMVTNGTSTPSGPPPNVTTRIDPGNTEPDDGRVYGIYVEEGVSLNSIGGQIQGSLGSGGSFTGSASGLNQNGSIDEDVASDRDPHDDEIQAILDGATASDRVTDFCGSPWESCTFSGPRTIVVDASEFNGGGRHVTFDVSSGNITLLVEGDLETTPPTNWEVTGHESGHSLDVYTTGDLSIGGSVYTTPGTSLNPFQPVTRWDEIKDEEYHPESLTFHAPSGSEVAVANGVRIEGSISAPGATAVGTSMSHQQIGAIYVGEWDVDSASLNLYPAPGSDGQPVDGSGPGDPGTIEVAVVDNSTGDGIEAVVVEVVNESGPVENSTTDSIGTVSADVSAGNYSLAIDHPDYHGTTVSDVRVNPSATTTVEVPLPERSSAPSRGHLKGEVLNVSSSPDSPVDNASIDIRHLNGTPFDQVRTVPNGSYSTSLPPGTYNVSVSHSEFDETDPTSVEIDPGATTWANASLETDVSVPSTGSVAVEVFNGTLTGPNGTAPVDGTDIGGASVELVHPDGTDVGNKSTHPNGNVTFSGVEARDGYEIEVNATDFEPNDRGGVKVVGGGETTVDVPMEPTGLNTTGTSGYRVSDSKLYYLHVTEIVLSVEDT